MPRKTSTLHLVILKPTYMPNKDEVLRKIKKLIESEISDLQLRKEFIEDELTDELDSWTSELEDEIEEANDQEDE